MKYLVSLIASVLTATALFATTTYVDAARPNDSGDGTSWATAKRTLQAAINMSAPGTTILVTNGVYTPISTDNKSINIQSVTGAATTIIDGANSQRCATLGSDQNATNTVLTGFTLRNGYVHYDYGGGSYYGTLNNCTLTGNSAGYGGGGSYGGTLNTCTLTSNSSAYFGYGGGSYGGTLNNCTLTANSASYGGGAYDCTLNTSTLSGNSAGYGGGASGGTLNNCTLAGNSSDVGGGAYYGTLNNCIVWGNEKNDGVLNNYDECTFSYSCTTPLPSGVGNRASDPFLLAAEDGDCRLLTGSPCLDAGTNGFACGETDLAGNPRIQNGIIDMGAYEGAVTPSALPAPLSVAASDGAYGDTIRVTWDAVPEATHYRIYRAVGMEGKKVAIGDWQTEVAFDDISPLSQETTYWYWVKAAKDMDGSERSLLSIPDTGSRSFAPKWFVDAARPDDSGDGLSWETAKRTIQAAIDLAAEVDSISVTNGLYSPITIASKALIIKSVNGAASTIIDGGGSQRCATLGSAIETQLCGFTVRNGHAAGDNGGGTYGGTLNNCTLTDNSAFYNGGGSYGGTLNNCTLTGNSAHNRGGGSSDGVLNNCELTGNSAGLSGGGSFDCTLNNCTLTGNSAVSNGGGSYYGTLNNCTLTGNSANTGGGSSGGTLNNCTLTGNAAEFVGGAYICTLNNCIAWGNMQTNSYIFINAVNDVLINNYDYNCALSYSCTTPLPPGAGNIASAPLFVAEEDGDYRLLTGSPCLDAGNNELTLGETDLAGTLRIQNGTVDMGAYEGAVTPSALPAPLSVAASDGANGDTIRVTWDAVPEATHYRVYRAADRDGKKETISGWQTELVFDDISPLSQETTYWYWVKAAKDMDGSERSLLSIPDTGSRSFVPTWFVDAARPDDSGDGLSWETAKRSIQAAVDLAAECDSITVTNGLYSPITTDNKLLVVKSVNGATVTIIDGGGNQRCAMLGGEMQTATQLCGFTLRNGVGTVIDLGNSYGGGSSGGTLNNCTLAGNSANHGGGAYGGTLNNCTLTGNSADYYGGGSYCATLNNCLLTGNSANVAGGSYGGTLNSCTVSENISSDGGGVCSGTYNNCVIWGNQASVGENYSTYRWPSVFSFSCTAPLPIGEGNVSADPLFVNPDLGNFRLALNSPCINAGANALAVGATDAAGQARIMDGRVDMGAYESLPLALALNCSNLVWTSGGDAYWFCQSATTADGSGAAQSGPLGDAQSVWLQAVTEGKGTLRFVWKVSSEERDYLRFYLDGQTVVALAGVTGWQTFTVAVTHAGAHTFRWEYAKGKSGAAGADAGWLDQAVWSPLLATVTVAAAPPEGGTVTGGGVVAAGSALTLVAAPNRGWRFGQWENADPNARRTLVVPDGGCACTATFVQEALPLAEALDTAVLAWAAGGDAPWNGWAMVSAHDGSDAAQSGAVGDLGSSQVGTEVAGPGTLTFWWRVSCEEDFDYLDFALDGLTLGWLTGESGWQRVTLTLGEGPHTLRWEYWKDESDAGGEDAGWLDQVTWTPTQTLTPVPVPYAWLDGYPLLLSLAGGDYDAAATGDADGDGHSAWQEYVAGSNPTNGESVLRAALEAGDGEPRVTWSPDLGTARVYAVEGRAFLTEGAWGATNAASRFFRVKVTMP